MSFLSFHFPKRKDNADVYTHLRKLFSGFFALTSVFAELGRLYGLYSISSFSYFWWNGGKCVLL